MAPTKTKKKAQAKRKRGTDEADKAGGPSLSAAEKRVVLIQYRKSGGDADRAEAVLAEYLRFMQIKTEDPSVRYAPSDAIDEMWHAHILSTEQYAAFCERHNGGAFIHHDPTMQDVPRRYRETMKSYAKLFGTPEDRDIWPEAEEESSEESEEDYDDYLDTMGCG
ncbi:hypothetical protein ACHAXT_002136 [Thalassiosira profunda]